MPLTDFLAASGQRIKGGEHGVVYASSGQIWFLKAPRVGIDANLFAATKIIVDHLQIVIAITSIDTGTHVPGSRHYDGRAEDIGLVWSAAPGITPARLGDAALLAKGRATLENTAAMTLARYLLANGWHVGEGAPPRPGLLFGPPGTAWNPTQIQHATHLHVSLPRALRVGFPGAEEEPEDSCEPQEDEAALAENQKLGESISSLRKGISGPEGPNGGRAGCPASQALRLA